MSEQNITVEDMDTGRIAYVRRLRNGRWHVRLRDNNRGKTFADFQQARAYAHNITN